MSAATSLAAVAIAKSGGAGGGLTTPDTTTRVSEENTAAAYSWGGSFAIAASPTDIFTIATGNEGRTLKVRSMSVQLFGDTASSATVPVSIVQRSTNTGGTVAATSLASRDPAQNGTIATVNRYSVNPSGLGGNAVNLAYGEALVGTNAAPAAPLVFDFVSSGAKMPTIRNIFGGIQRIIAVNLGGTSLPANPRAVINLVLEEETKRMVIILGDSLVSNDTGFRALPGYYPGDTANNDIRFYGSNGKRLLDFLPTAEANLSGLTFPPSTFISSVPDYGTSAYQPEIVLHYGTNDVRQGLTSLGEMVARIDAFLQMVKYGTTNGATFTSNYTTRAGVTYPSRTFTWNATLAAKHHCRVWLFIPNSYLADDPTAGSFISNSGEIAGANLAAAAQNATDMIWTAYKAFEGDPRLNGGGIIDSQTYVSPRTGYSFGRTVKTFANNGILMRDQLHPSYDVGGPHKWEQLSAAIGL